MADSATVTAAQIAELAGVGRAAVSNWRKRYDDFPEPVGGTSKSPTFALAEVESWLRGQGKLSQVDAEHRLWHEFDASRGEAPLSVTLVWLGVFLRHLQEHPAQRTWISRSAQDEVVEQRVSPFGSLAPALGKLAAELPSAPAKRFTRVDAVLFRALAELAATEDVAAIFDRMVDRYQREQKYGATSETAAEVMAALGGSGNSVLDPACGTGSLLLAAGRRGAADLRGQEISYDLANLAALRLALHGDRATIRAGDSLAGGTFDGELADLVLCEPPFGVRGWEPDEHAYDPRFEYGLPPRGEPELVWVQHCLANVRAGGRVVVLVPSGVGFRSGGRRVRGELVRRGALRAVFALPAGLLTHTGIPVQAWVLRRPDHVTKPDRVLMADLTGTTPERLPATVRELDAAAAREANLDRPGVARSVPAIDLLDDAVNLTPARWLSAPAVEIGADEIRTGTDRLSALLKRAKPIDPTITPGSAAPSLVSVAELVGRGAVQVIATPARSTGSDGEEQMLLAADVVAGRAATGTGTADERTPRVQPGDVIVPVLAKTLTPRVSPDQGALLGPHLVLLRLDPEVLDSWFVAGFLRTPENARIATSQGSIHRVDVRQARLPVLPIETQRRYGAHFRRLDELRDTLGAAAALADELAKTTASAAAVGTIELPG